MDTAASLMDRIVVLESVIAHLQHDVAQMNSVILRQQTELDELRQSLVRLESQLKQADAGPEVRNAEEERPPHW